MKLHQVNSKVNSRVFGFDSKLYIQILSKLTAFHLPGVISHHLQLIQLSRHFLTNVWPDANITTPYANLFVKG